MPSFRSLCVTARPRRAAAALTAALLLSACAGLSDSGTPEEQVARRAQARWDALVKRDFDAAYAYIQPAYRAVVSIEDYKKTFGAAGQWKSAQIQQVTCQAERCAARIRLTTATLLPQFAQRIPETTTHFDETWVRDEGRWWFFQAP
jgi:hypothetical protein